VLHDVDEDKSENTHREHCECHATAIAKEMHPAKWEAKIDGEARQGSEGCGLSECQGSPNSSAG
jgi:hypothetical protein